MRTPQVAGLMSSRSIGGCPCFPTDKSLGKKFRNRITQGQKQIHWLECYYSDSICTVDKMLDRKVMLHWNDLDWNELWFATNGCVSSTSQNMSIEHTVFSVLIWKHVSYQSYTTCHRWFCPYCVEIRHNKRCPLLTEPHPSGRETRQVCYFSTLRRRYRIWILHSIRLLKKSNTVDTTYLVIEMRSRNHRQRTESTAECQKRSIDVALRAV